MLFSESLKKNSDFQKVYRAGDSRANAFLVMYKIKAASEKNRIGISVSKKVGNSVVRHRLKRLVRESYRLNEESFQKGYDIVIIIRASARNKSHRKIESALLHLAKIHGLYCEE